MGVIDDYIAGFEGKTQDQLKIIYKVIKETAPELEEKISWGMPTFALSHNIIHFAAHKAHIGLYPGAEAVEHFADALKGYKTSKGAIQFPIDREIDTDLIRRILQFNLSRKDGSRVVL